jgi:hypothetical protein
MGLIPTPMDLVFPSASPEFLYANLLSHLREGYALLDPDPLDAYPSIRVGQIVDMRCAPYGSIHWILMTTHIPRLLGPILGKQYL